MHPENKLTWALAIATINRGDILPKAIRHALHQTCLPIEIVIVDASENWLEIKKVVECELQRSKSTAKLIYVEAVKASSASQRNQAAALASADLLFLFDDDSLMFPDCAERIIEVFRHPDARDFVGACAELSNFEPSHPMATVGLYKTMQANSGGYRETFQNHLNDFLVIFIEYLRGLYLPNYDSPQKEWHISSKVFETFGCIPRRQVHGCRMIFRKSTFAKELFDDSLLRYAYLEDCDFGYRAGRIGPIVLIPHAKICHLEVGVTTARRKFKNTLAVTNAAYLLKKNAQKPVHSIVVLILHAIRRLFLDLLKDISNFDYKLNGVRGTLRGIYYAYKIAFLHEERLAQEYYKLQEKITNQCSP